MSHDAGARCVCQVRHRPEPLELARHHIWPEAMGGPTVAANLVWLCPTAHANVHELLRLMLRVGPLTWREVGARYVAPVSLYAFRLAHEGLRRIDARSVTP